MYEQHLVMQSIFLVNSAAVARESLAVWFNLISAKAKKYSDPTFSVAFSIFGE